MSSTTPEQLNALRELLREDPEAILRRNPDHVRRLIDRARAEGKDRIAEEIEEIAAEAGVSC